MAKAHRGIVKIYLLDQVPRVVYEIVGDYAYYYEKAKSTDSASGKFNNTYKYAKSTKNGSSVEYHILFSYAGFIEHCFDGNGYSNKIDDGFTIYCKNNSKDIGKLKSRLQSKREAIDKIFEERKSRYYRDSVS